MEDAQVLQVNRALARHGFEHPAAHKADVGLALQHRLHHQILRKTEKAHTAFARHVDAKVLQDVQLQQVGGKRGGVYRRNGLAAHVAQRGNVAALTAAKDHAAKLVHGLAVLAFDQGRHARYAVFGLQQDVVLGVGDDEVHLLACRSGLQLRQCHGNGFEMHPGELLREVLQRRRPLAQGHRRIAKRGDPDAVRHPRGDGSSNGSFGEVRGVRAGGGGQAKVREHSPTDQQQGQQIPPSAARRSAFLCHIDNEVYA